MPDDLPTWIVWLLGLGAAAGALWQIGRVMTAVGQWLDTVMTNVVRRELRPIMEQLEPNGGKSMRDSLDRLEKWARCHDPEGWGQ